MGKELKVIAVSELFEGAYYEVPIYQRNYAWEAAQIDQLLEDIESVEEDYFLGNLIVNQKANAGYEVIDGQQRLTTLYLLERYLGMPFAQDALRFEAREKSNHTLAEIDKEKGEDQAPEILKGYKIINDYFQKGQSSEGGLEQKKTAFKEKLKKVRMIRIQVPKKIDLNHYFEIMNTRGEQLELHEIAKAKMLSQLTDTLDKKLAVVIWESCANMNGYVQMNFSTDERSRIFSEDWSGLSSKVTDFASLKEVYQSVNNEEQEMGAQENSLVLSKILECREKTNIQDRKEEQANKRFESILSFPNFLLQVNAVMSKKKNDDASLDDKYFMKNLAQNWKDETSVCAFLFSLLKCRVLFDKFVLKREYNGGYSESREWSLKKIKKEKGNVQYAGTFGEESHNKQIIILQSALRITYTSPKTMHWVSLVLSMCWENEDTCVLEVLEQYAKEKVREANYQEVKGFEFERIVFTYLDYLLYRDGYDYNGKTVIKSFADDWKFQFRSSIEHFYPQHPAEGEEWDSSELNCFGNLALITVSGNSTLSNLSPAEKYKENSEIIQQSLKLKIMAKMMNENKNENEWTPALAKEHENEMFEKLSADLKISR